MKDLHELLKPYEFDKHYYKDEGYDTLLYYLMDYANAHPWFHWHGRVIEESNPRYFHYAVVYWTESERPTLNVFSFIRIYYDRLKVEINDDDIE